MARYPRASAVKVTKADGTISYRAPKGTMLAGPPRPPVPKAVVKQVYARDGLRCRYCGFRHANPAKFHIDHVMPVSLGGDSVLANLVVACERCNRLKGPTPWTPIPLWDLCDIDVPLEPFSVLRMQGFSVAEASERLRRIH